METINVTIEKTAESATVRNDGFTDILYRRVITDTASGEVIVRDVVCEIVENALVAEEIAKLRETRPSAEQAT